MITCPICHGSGRIHMAFVSFVPGTTEEEKQQTYREGLTCSPCGGTGEVHPDFPQWQHKAKKLKRAIRDGGYTIRTAAQKLGISISELSQMENGHIEPDMSIPWRLMEEGVYGRMNDE